MGHRRVGELPKTQRWRDLIKDLEAFSGEPDDVARVVTSTLDSVKHQFRHLEKDPIVFSSFRFLVAFAVSNQATEPSKFLETNGIDPPDSTSPLEIARAFVHYLELKNEKPEYSSLVKSAGCDAIAAFHRKHLPETPPLFESAIDPYEPWRKLGSGQGFCEISRLFFASLTNRYLRYFLEREASSSIKTLFERDLFDRQLSSHVDHISQHAFETAKITESFSAGWFNKRAIERIPSERDINGFLSLAFGKMRDELGVEADRL